MLSVVLCSLKRLSATYVLPGIHFSFPPLRFYFPLALFLSVAFSWREELSAVERIG